MVITSTGRMTSEALRGFAPPAFPPFGRERFSKHQPFTIFPTNAEHQPFCVGYSVKDHITAMQISVKI
nr:MAG TPA: hypothetical protein [Caudoviricetes sp.]